MVLKIDPTNINGMMKIQGLLLKETLCGLINCCLVGPFILPNQLTGERYFQFLTESLPELLDVVTLNFHRGMIFQHHVTPPHVRLLFLEMV